MTLLEAQAGAAERLVLGQIKRRLDAAEPAQLGPATLPPAAATPAGSETENGMPTVADQMRALLKSSVRDTPDQSRRTLHEVLVGELVPDEARILSALSDGTAYAMVHIAEPGVGSHRKRVVENASAVGRAAGVALPNRVPLYISHLRRLGLVVPGPEDEALREEYEILLTEPTLRVAIAEVGKGPLGARIIRRTVRISDLGRELWEAAQGPGDVDAGPTAPPQ